MNPILPADVDQVLDADVFVCVPITDYEVGPPTLRHIKEHSRATVVLDAHGATMTLTRSGERHPRVWADLDVWLPYIDILKMNLDEAGSAWLGKSAEVAAEPRRLSNEELRGLAHHCLDRGVGAVCVTLDERGCVAFYRDGSGGIAEESVDRIEVEHVVDTTGAGDSFAGGLAYGYLAVPELRRGLPVRERDGRSALYRDGTGRIPLTRGNGAADPLGVRPSTAGGTSLNHAGGTDSGWLIVQVGSAAAPGTVSIGGTCRTKGMDTPSARPARRR